MAKTTRKVTKQKRDDGLSIYTVDYTKEHNMKVDIEAKSESDAIAKADAWLKDNPPLK